MTRSTMRCGVRWTPSFAFVSLTGALVAGEASAQTSTVSAVSPTSAISTTRPSVTVPVTLTRTDNTSILGFSIEFTLSGNLTLASGTGSVTLGTFLSTSNPNTDLQVTTVGPGDYRADGVTLGAPCGSTATSGTLLNIPVSSVVLSGTGTVTVVDVRLRDCNNNPLPAVIGSAASVVIDNQPPSVAVGSPNGGEFWLLGSTHSINWTATDNAAVAAGGVDLAFSPDSGATWTAIASGLDNTGVYAWTIPAIPRTIATRVRVIARDVNGNASQDSSNTPFTLAVAPLAVAPLRPGVTGLMAPVPDPFQGSATIGFTLGRPERVDLAVYGVDGRRIRTLERGTRDPGVFRVVWDGRDAGGALVPPGVYFVRLAAGSERFTTRATRLE
jgi:FlgD Ig-like domain